MTLDDLQPFCSTAPTREGLHRPFNASGYTCASDGRIIVRVPQIEGCESHPDAPHDIAHLFPSHDGFTVAELPDKWQEMRNKKHPCGLCQGTKVTECDKCGHEESCDYCDDQGMIEENKTVPVNGGMAHANLNYLKLIHTLPNVRFLYSFSYHAFAFTFDGGEGMLTKSRFPE